MSTLIHVGTLITANSRGDVLHDAAILIEHDHIAAIFSEHAAIQVTAAEVVNASDRVIVPGFVQTHIHLCQTLFRGLADDLSLLDWLQQKIFPLESAHNEGSMHTSAMLGIAELIRSGTTTIMDMGSIHHEEEIIRAIGETGIRAFVGKAMMDVNNVYPKLIEPTHDALRSTRDLAERWHNSYDGRVRYAAAPRFVLSCTDQLLREAFEMIDSRDGMLFHTHAAENRREVKEVCKRFGKENVHALNDLGLLSDKTCLAHCVHLADSEVRMLQYTGTNVAHCPSSNLKLGSGVANIPKLIEYGITVSLGADGAPCNNTLDMFQEMRLASLIQKPMHGPTAMPARTVFEMATTGGARALGLVGEIGSIEVGKKADLVVLNLDEVWNPTLPDADIYSTLVYSCRPENVESVMIDGRWVYQKKSFTTLDEEQTRTDARTELKKLLERLDT